MSAVPLNAIRAFEVAARKLSFSAAGDELHVTHAAVSHQIKHLEEWLGVPLFHRRSRQVQLTEAGEILAASASRALSEIAATCRRLRRDAGRQSLSVGCIPSIATRWLVPRLASFTSQHPGIAMRVVYARAEEKFGDSDNDVLITLGADPAPDVVNIKVFSRVNYPVCSPHYLAARGPFSAPADIAAGDLLHDETREGWREWLGIAGVEGADVGAGPVFADFNILATAVIAGHGIALCPVEVFREELKRGDLVVLSDIASNRDKSYFLTMPAQAEPATLTFTKWFMREVSPQG